MAVVEGACVLASVSATREAVWGPFSPNSAVIPAERTFLVRKRPKQAVISFVEFT